ncbi:MAG: type II secretion system protein [Halobacteriaceae archaeon]
MSAVRSLTAAVAAWVPSPSRSLDRSLGTLGVDRSAEAVVALGYGLAVVGLLGGAVAALVTGSPLPGFVGAGAGAIGGYAVLWFPRWLATVRRARALGSAPELLALAVLRVHLEPTLEGAAAFAADHGHGPLADGLARSVRRARGTPDAGWTAFADRWGDWGPAIHRAVGLLDAAVAAPSADRGRFLDRALDAVLDGVRDRTARYAAAIRGPVGALYAFGVVLPLALVGALPAVRTAGVAVPLVALAAVFDVLLPVALLAGGAWVVGRRPTAFPPSPVPRTHPRVPDRRAHATAAAVGVASLAWLAGGSLVPVWTRPVLLAAAPGAALVVWFRPVVAVRERVRDLEAGLGDALAVVGGRLRRGDALERAVEVAGESLDGPAGRVFRDAARTGDRLGLDGRASLVGADGALSTVPSRRARAAATLVVRAASAGSRGGTVLVEVADHLDALHRVERESRANLRTVVSTLRSTALCFGPLVGGATVALAARIDAAGVDRVPGSLPVGALGAVVGGYVVVTAVLLAALAAALDRGLDRAAIGYAIGVALCSAPPVFALTAALSARLL